MRGACEDYVALNMARRLPKHHVIIKVYMSLWGMALRAFVLQPLAASH